MNPHDPHEMFVRELRAVPGARVAFLLQPVVAVLSAGSLLGLRTWIHDAVDAMQAKETVPAPPSTSLASVASWSSIITLVLIAMWAWRVASTGRALGSPTRMPPWLTGFGFFIPIANFFVPYLGIAGALPAGDPARRALRHWWWAFIAQTAGQALVLLLLYGSEAMGIVGVVAVGLAGLAHAYFGERALREVVMAHEHYTAAHLPSEE